MNSFALFETGRFMSAFFKGQKTWFLINGRAIYCFLSLCKNLIKFLHKNLVQKFFARFEAAREFYA